ncbi:prepilin-type N-terminal cleavage/methylation domain-containing protein [Candidatus Parcubacteria bacterium]|nr:prepilin-type N-terminal cleavage/methylation domain-containing protein [Candidatus Parcubacteria bacterium]
MRRAKKYRSDKGFTLIELLVSVAVLALVVSIVYASLSWVKYDAYAARVRSDATLLKNAIDLYYRENNDWPPVNSWVIYTTLEGGGWSTLLTTLGLPQTVLPPYPSTGIPPYTLDAGYMYLQANAVNGMWRIMGDQCLMLRDGYFFALRLPEATNASMYDGGVDAYSIEYFDGQFDTYPTSDPAVCH